MSSEQSDSDDDDFMFGAGMPSISGVEDDEEVVQEEAFTAAIQDDENGAVARLCRALLSGDDGRVLGAVKDLAEAAPPSARELCEGLGADVACLVEGRYLEALRGPNDCDKSSDAADKGEVKNIAGAPNTPSSAAAAAAAAPGSIAWQLIAPATPEECAAAAKANAAAGEGSPGASTPAALRIIRRRVLDYVSAGRRSGKASPAGATSSPAGRRSIGGAASAGTAIEATMRALRVLCGGIAALNCFLQANYVGPEVKPEELPETPVLLANADLGVSPPLPQSAPAPTSADAATSNAAALALLAVDGELAYRGSIGVGLLVVARAVLLTLADPTMPPWTTPVTDANVRRSDDSSGGDEGDETDEGSGGGQGEARNSSRPHGKATPAAAAAAGAPALFSGAEGSEERLARAGVLDRSAIDDARPRLTDDVPLLLVNVLLGGSSGGSGNNNGVGAGSGDGSGNNGVGAGAGGGGGVGGAPGLRTGKGSTMVVGRRRSALQGCIAWWSARCSLTHHRLLFAGDATSTLWSECSHFSQVSLLAFAAPLPSSASPEHGQVVAVDPKTELDRSTKTGSGSGAAGGGGGGVVAWGNNNNDDDEAAAADVGRLAWLETGLAQYHFDRGDGGKACFEASRRRAGLKVEMTGALGKRTKFQTTSHAQMVIRASSSLAPRPAPRLATEGAKEAKSSTAAAEAGSSDRVSAGEDDATRGVPKVEKQADDSILLERTAMDLEEEADRLSAEDLAVLLALCLDVKNSNPKDGLTAVEMRPYLERVLLHHANWTIYSTALLQRAWLDFESYYSKDRATLQLQALVDQHTDDLTFTQLSSAAIEDSAPAQDRLRFLHSIVYPPRWELKKDLAERYASLGILVSAARLFEDLELWDDVVDCYSRMGKKKEALALVRSRLARGDPETPRMLCALGDLMAAPESTAHYEKAWALSRGRYAKAKRRVGREAFNLANQAAAAKAKEEAAKEAKEGAAKAALSGESSSGASGRNSSSSSSGEKEEEERDDGNDEATRGHLRRAQGALRAALSLQPSQTSDWFVLGTVCMRLHDWQAALTAFSTVVAHAPESGDAWGNVGAVHLRLRRPDLALAAFTEGLKSSRESWRMWENRLLAALQVRPLTATHANDAVFTANQLLDLKQRNLGRGLDTPLLAAIVSAALTSEGFTPGEEPLATPSAEGGAGAGAGGAGAGGGGGGGDLGDEEALDGARFKAYPVARKAGRLLERVTENHGTGAAVDAKAWEVAALFNASCGRPRAARGCHLKRVRQLQASPGWEKKTGDMNALADAVHDFAFLGCRCQRISSSIEQPQPQPQPQRGGGGGGEPMAAMVMRATVDDDGKELVLAQLLIRGILKKASAFGSVAEKGNAARAKLQEALAAVDAALEMARQKTARAAAD